jgi:hypothetical protein
MPVSDARNQRHGSAEDRVGLWVISDQRLPGGPEISFLDSAT